MTKFNLLYQEGQEPFMVLTADALDATPTKIEKGSYDGLSPVSYAERLATGSLRASVQAIASRMGRDVIIEEASEGSALVKAIAKARTGTVEEAEYDLTADGEIVKMDKAQQIVFGWAYVTHDKSGAVNIDKSGDFVDEIEEIEKTAYDYVLKSRAADADHTNVKGGEMVESIVFTPEKIAKMGIPEGVVPLGWWVGYKIHDKATWERVEKGELTAFSVHGTGTRAKVAED